MASNAAPAPAPAKEIARSIVVLDEPIVLNEGSPAITQVEVRKPAAGELRGLKLVDVINVDVAAMITLLPRVTNPPLHQLILNTMNVSDFVALSNEVALFLPQKGALTDSLPA